MIRAVNNMILPNTQTIFQNSVTAGSMTGPMKSVNFEEVLAENIEKENVEAQQENEIRTVNEGSNSTEKKSDNSATSDLEDIFARASQKYNVPLNLLKAVGKQESNFQNSVVSHAGAQGIMQLMPGTAKYLGVTDPFDAEQNIMGGAKYLSQMLEQFDGNIVLALAAYNAGPGSVTKYGGVPPYSETQNYVKKVTQYMQEEITIPNSSPVSTKSSNTNVTTASETNTNATTTSQSEVIIDKTSYTPPVKIEEEADLTKTDNMANYVDEIDDEKLVTTVEGEIEIESEEEDTDYIISEEEIWDKWAEDMEDEIEEEYVVSSEEDWLSPYLAMGFQTNVILVNTLNKMHEEA